MKKVLVTFHGNSKDYCYHTDLALKTDDLVLVETPSGEFKVVTVTQVNGISTYDRSKANKWIVGKIDLEEYEKKKQQRLLAREIRIRLRDRKEEMEEITLFKLLAKDDPEMQKLLKQLTDIEGKNATPTIEI